MNEDDFEGTLVLEKIAEINKVDEFFEAIDSDDLEEVKCLMRKAGVDRESQEIVLRKISEGEQ